MHRIFNRALHKTKSLTWQNQFIILIPIFQKSKEYKSQIKCLSNVSPRGSVDGYNYWNCLSTFRFVIEWGLEWNCDTSIIDLNFSCVLVNPSLLHCKCNWLESTLNKLRDSLLIIVCNWLQYYLLIGEELRENRNLINRR